MSAGVVTRLPDGWGTLRLECTSADRCPAATRSYSSDEARLSWTPGPALAHARPCACDFECERREPATELLAFVREREDFLRFWVLGELVAKLLDVPMLELLRRHRQGAMPVLPVGTLAAVVTHWRSRYTVALGGRPQRPVSRVTWQAVGSDWGIPSVTEWGADRLADSWELMDRSGDWIGEEADGARASAGHDARHHAPAGPAGWVR